MKFLVPILFSLLILSCAEKKSAEPESPASTETQPMAPAEFADPKYIEMGKKGLQALSSGDIAAWMNDFAENAVYRWNNGDSLVGKPAITEYWTNRRGNAISSITFTDQVWLPVKVNQPQAIESSGIWLLSWFKTTATYKTGKSMTQWIHTDYHFDSNDKIDQVIQYLDRVPINAANMQ